MSFRVICDEIFINYLETGFVKLELYVSEGMETFSIAKANIPLKDLVKKTLGEGVAPAMSSSITFFGEKDQIVGLMNFRMRMKFPIGESLKWMKEKRELGIIEEEVGHLDENIKRKRKLIVIIDKATGLSSRCLSFVVYSIDGKVLNNFSYFKSWAFILFDFFNKINELECVFFQSIYRSFSHKCVLCFILLGLSYNSSTWSKS